VFKKHRKEEHVMEKAGRQAEAEAGRERAGRPARSAQVARHCMRRNMPASRRAHGTG